MRLLLQTWTANFFRWCKDAARGWDWFWFTPVDPMTVGFVRLLAGSILLYLHLACLPDLANLIGPEAWIDRQAVQELSGLQNYPAIQTQDSDPPMLKREKYYERQFATWYRIPFWEFIQAPWLLWTIELIFIACMFCYAIGFCSRTMAVISWFAHLSYVSRGFMIWFGMDAYLMFILFYLTFAPTGAALSVDRLIARYRAWKRTGKSDTGMEPTLSWGANAALRCLQIHMGIAYLCAALAKLQGASWWNGGATWLSMNTSELSLFDMRWLGRLEINWFGQPQWLWEWVCSLATFGTIAFELVFIFLVWLRWWRPLMLVGALLLHGGIGLFMGLFGFGVVMLAGCAAFLMPEEVRWFFMALFKGPTGFRFVFDRENPAQWRQARLIAAFDAWHQVELIETHEAKKTPAPPGTLVLPNGSTHQGMDAFWKLVRPLRTLWLAWPVAFWFFRANAQETRTVVPPSQPVEHEKAVGLKKAV